MLKVNKRFITRIAHDQKLAAARMEALKNISTCGKGWKGYKTDVVIFDDNDAIEAVLATVENK